MQTNTQSHPAVAAYRLLISNSLRALAIGLASMLWATASHGQASLTLADEPIFSTLDVPGNLVLALSVEFPTAVTAAERNPYTIDKKYFGYFDSQKCYTYRANVATYGNYFEPAGPVSMPNYTCSGKWSGNFLNWATMQAVDPFRWALTGGYRSIDEQAVTILEKAWAPNGQGSASGNFPNNVAPTNISLSSLTPFGGSTFNMHVVQCGNLMVFSRDRAVDQDACPTNPTAWDGAASTATGVFSVQVRVQVCVNDSAHNNLPEANCVRYGNNYKPEGLVQKYANKIRYSAFGYLTDPVNAGSKLRDGGVLRARMKFVGPTQPVPGSSAIRNQRSAVPGQITSAEWCGTTGIFETNPDTDDATSSSEPGSVVGNSGVINYLNQFGQTSKAYKRYDPVSELYYAATRYLRNLGDVPEYSDLSKFNNGVSTLANRTLMKDGFPVIRNWTDPILYSCQKNFVLGIGDTNSNQDKDLPGNTDYRTDEPSMPAAVSSDTINAVTATNKVGVIEGRGATIGNTNQYNANANSAYMAGLAYQFNTTDIRADLAGKQTISTFWLDVLENGDYKTGGGRNQFYLTAKYGGFNVPANYSFETNTTALPRNLWATTSDTIPIPSANSPRPDNYFIANQADKMVDGLTSAFSRIATGSGATTTSFSVPLPQVTETNAGSYSTSYDPANWTGELTGSSIAFSDSAGAALATPELTSRWVFSTKLSDQVSGSGWDTNRRVVTWSGVAGIAFRPTPLNPDKALLDPSYVTGDDSSNYINYLRGDRSNEADASSGTGVYRTRTKLVGDIVGSKAQVVGAPSFPFSEATNTGYAAFRSQWADRRTMVYVGTNYGMLHAVNGALLTTQPSPAPTPALEVDADAGKEMFAYVPRALLAGPSSPATPSVNGLASLGNPVFSHHYMVNSTPVVFDIDFARTRGAPSSASDWRSVLIGGLGKGGKSYYAIDVTDPIGMSVNESTAASKVLWEFTDPSLGYSFGEPIVTKTRKYGWVAIFVSGYNNADGIGYFFIVNPRTGALLDKISTGVGSPSNEAGLAQVNAFVVDATDGTTDAVYAGDLLGNLWRLDVTGTTGATYAVPNANPLRMATFRDASGNAQPVTSRPVIEVHPITRKRFVMVGTGRLLNTTDRASTLPQSFYAIADGTNASFNTSLASPLGYPVTRSMLMQSTDANSLLAGGAATFDPTTQIGWYIDLGTDSGSGVAYRVTTDATTLAGAVAFAATTSNTDPCTPSGTSRVYARNYATTTTTLTTVVNNATSGLAVAPLSGNVTDLRFLSVGGKATLLGGTDAGTVSKLPITPAVPLLLRRLNWRELQTVD